jgi:hypothetical protein
VYLLVTITNPQNGSSEVLAANTAGTSLVAAWDSGSSTLAISGSAPSSEFQQVLRSVTYNNTSQNPGTTARLVEFVANDGLILTKP